MPTISHQFNIINRCSGFYRAERLKETDLGPNHHSYIFSVCRHPGISQEELTHRVHIHKSNVTRHLAYLVSCGYVKRVQSEEDKRVMLVYPTEKAEAVLPLLREIVHDWDDAVTEGFTEEEIEQLKSMLARIRVKAAELAHNEEQKED